MSDFETRDYASGFRDGKRDAEATITRLTKEVERLRALLKAVSIETKADIDNLTARVEGRNWRRR